VAYLNDQMIELSARELSLLEVLLQRSGRLVSKDQLVERLCEWGEEVSNNAIEVYIHRLRKKIEQGPGAHRHRARPGLLPREDRSLTGRPAHPTRQRPGIPRNPRHGRSPRAAQREQLSLFGEILDWMLAPLLLLWPMSVALTWLVAQNIANRPYDRELGELTREVAGQVAALNSSEAPIRNRARMEMDLAVARLLKSDDEDRVFFQVLGTRGEFVAGDADLPVPLDPPGPGNGVRFRDDELRDEAVRVAYLWLPALAVDGGSGPLVQIAETLDKRSRLATEIIKGVILPQFVILPLAVLLVWLALARGIRPLAELQQRIRGRESSRPQPDRRARRARRGGAAGQRHQRPAAAAGPVHQLAAPLPGRRRAPAEDAAGRGCARRPSWPNARSTAAMATRRR
jgi:hypothetical protein